MVYKESISLNALKEPLLKKHPDSLCANCFASSANTVLGLLDFFQFPWKIYTNVSNCNPFAFV